MDVARDRINKWYEEGISDIPLDLSNLGLEKLPHLPSNLVKLNCSNNRLTVLEDLPELLQYLNCSKNQIYLIEELPLNCRYIDCSYNQLRTLPRLPIDCVYLNISHNQFDSLPKLPDTIEYINYFNNNIDDKVYDDLVLMPNVKNINGAVISFIDPVVPIPYTYSQIPSPKLKISKCIYKNTMQDVEEYLMKSKDNIVTGSDTFYNCCKRSNITNVYRKVKFMKTEYSLLPCINRWVNNNDFRKLLNKQYVIFKFIDSDIQFEGTNIAYIIPYTMDDYTMNE